MAALQSKYSSLIDKANDLGISLNTVSEENGKLKLQGMAPYQMQKDQFWDEMKSSGGESEVDADIKVSNTDYYGEYTIKSGDTLSAISKRFLGDSSKYMLIADANPDTITDPDSINAGATIKLPMAAALH